MIIDREREKVIKGLECCSVEQSCLECPWGGKDCNDRLHMAVLELLKEQQQWIRVEDRLPERYKKVLTYGTDYGVQENWLIRVEKGISWSMGYHITHWMPLPEPPKEEN